MPSTRVAVVDDHQLVRIGLKQIIEAQSDFAWVGEAKNGREALTLLRGIPCDVLLLDLSLPDMSGLDVLRGIKSHQESVATLVLPAYPEKSYGVNGVRAAASRVGLRKGTAVPSGPNPGHPFPRKRSRSLSCSPITRRISCATIA